MNICNRSFWLALALIFVWCTLLKAEPNQLPAQGIYLQTLQAAGVEPSGQGAVEFLRQLHPSAQRQREIALLVQQLGDTSFARREAAMQELLRQPNLPLEALNRAVDGADPEVRWRARRILKDSSSRSSEVMFAAFRIIADESPNGAAAQILAALPLCGETHLRNAALTAMRAAAKAEDRTLLANAMTQDDEITRHTAAAGLAAITTEEDHAQLYPLIEDRQETVALEVTNALADRGDRRSLAALVRLMTSDNLATRSSAFATLRGLTGENLDYAAYDSKEKRQESTARWRTWVADRGATAELSFPVVRNLSARGDLAGHTLVATGGNGKVIEFDAGYKEVWSYPIASWNAEKLRNGNVLIGSYNANKVIEVDQAGKVVWEFPNIKAMTAKPLHNGNILVADFSGNRVVEINRDKKIVWQHPTGDNCFDSDRLPNGNTIFGCPNYVKEVTPDHTVVREWKIDGRLNGFHALANGNLLVANYGQNKIVELTPQGKQVWQFDERQPSDVFRLPNGNTLISTNQRIIEIGPDSQLIKEICKASYGSARR